MFSTHQEETFEQNSFVPVEDFHEFSQSQMQPHFYSKSLDIIYQKKLKVRCMARGHFVSFVVGGGVFSHHELVRRLSSGEQCQPILYLS